MVPSLELNTLQADIERICKRFGVPSNHKQFASHVILARLRNTSSLGVAHYLSARGNFATMSFTVGRCVPMSSRDFVGGRPYLIEEA